MTDPRTELDCPLCHDMAADEDDVPEHIRWQCLVAIRLRVEEFDLPPEGRREGTARQDRSRRPGTVPGGSER